MMNMASQEKLEKLLLLFQHLPVAIAEIDGQGFIRQLNPRAVQLMMPLVAQLGLPGDNLIDTLTGFLPAVGETIANFKKESGLVIDQELYMIRFVAGTTQVERQFSLTIEKINAEKWLVFFDDITDLLKKVVVLPQKP